MDSRTRVALLVAGSLISALLVPALAQAKTAKISGKLSARGYTVIALAASGEAKTDRAPRGDFDLRPPARKVTLQLRAPDGTYAGPIVVAKKAHGKRAVVGVEAGATVGKVRVDSGDGYATLAKRLDRDHVNLKRIAHAEKGAPLGAGNLGRVRSPTGRGAPGDADLDGIPNPLDVDDDGDVVLDRFDPERIAAAAAEDAGDVVVRGISLLDIDQHHVVNANAPGLTEAQVSEALANHGGLILGSLGIEVNPGTDGQPDTAVELDCGDPDTGLVYCRRNGSTGRVTPVGQVPRPPETTDPHRPYYDYPACCDGDEDGFGSLGWGVIPASGANADAVHVHTVALLHGASRDQVGADDLLVVRATGDDSNAAFTGTLSSLFETVPALVSYEDEAGNSTAMTYPVATAPFVPPGVEEDPGARNNPFVPTDGPDADTDVEVTLTFWRPQRSALPGEPGRWIDVGHSAYVAGHRAGSDYPFFFEGGGCPADAYSEADPNLALTQAPDFPRFFESVPALEDSADDQPADPANTFTFTLNLNRCFGEFAVEQHLTSGLTLRAQPANPLPGPPDMARATVAWFKPG